MFPFNILADDTEFNNCSFTYSFSDNVNSNLIHNFYSCLFKAHKRCCRDLDPDKYFFNSNNYLGDEYYLKDSIKNLLQGRSIKDEFSILHLNVRSLPHNLDDFNLNLSRLKHSFSVIAFSETRATFFDENSLIISGIYLYLYTR
jgi:hypothetical protein